MDKIIIDFNKISKETGKQDPQVFFQSLIELSEEFSEIIKKGD